MKHYFAVLLGALFCFTALPTSAEARDHRRDRGRDRHHRHYDRHDRRHYSSHRHSRREWRRGHYVYSRGHRVFIPARYVVVYF